MAFRTQKISQMTPKGSNLEGSDLLEVSTLESGSYVTRSITGQEIIDAAAGSGVTAVTGTNPIVSSGGATPDISIRQSSNVDDGYLSSTDWNTFNDKQDALTLTTTGTSGAATLVGSTLNIPQYGGGGGGGIHGLVIPKSGNSTTTMNAPSTLGTLNVVVNRMYAIPFIPNTTFATSNFYINVTNNLVSSNAKIMVYSNLNGQPNSLLYESANLDCSTLGIKTATTTFTFTAGTTYWFCFWANSAIGVSSVAIGNQCLIAFNGTTVVTNYINLVTYGSAPNPFGTTTNNNSSFPFIGATI